jgi:thiol-disulfide isomerase/thioredoxin
MGNNYTLHYIVALFLTVFTLCSYSQHPAKESSIKLKLENCPDTFLILTYPDRQTGDVTDTITRMTDGVFLIKRKIDHPAIATVYSRNVFINNLNVAPGYQLQISGNAFDFSSLKSTMQINGRGAANNAYRTRLDSELPNWKIDFTPYDKDEARAIAALIRFRQLKDDLVKEVYEKREGQDRYSSVFGRAQRLANELEQFSSFIDYANNNKLSAAYTYRVLISRFGFNEKRLMADSLLFLPAFRQFLLSDYLKLRSNIDNIRSDSGHQNSTLLIDHVVKVFSGNIRKYLLSETLSQNISNAATLVELSGYAKAVDRYKAIIGQVDRMQLASAISMKSSELSGSVIGNIAPDLWGVDSSGKRSSIRQFRGKVVYLDLWASWCVPCRKETPFLKELHAKYNQEDKIVFISLSFSDHYLPWKKAVLDDAPGWLQLYDINNSVGRFFQGVIMIPRFILIDKKGTIANFNAPMPSDSSRLNELIQAELQK